MTILSLTLHNKCIVFSRRTEPAAAKFWRITHSMIQYHQKKAEAVEAYDTLCPDIIRALKGKGPAEIDRITGHVVAGFDVNTRGILGKEMFDQNDIQTLNAFDPSLSERHRRYQMFAVYLHVLRDVGTSRVAAIYAGQTCNMKGFRFRLSEHVGAKRTGRKVIERRLEKANEAKIAKTMKDSKWRRPRKLSYHHDVLLNEKYKQDMRIAATYPMQDRFKTIVTLAEELLVCRFDLFDTVTDCGFARARQQLAQDSGIAFKHDNQYLGLNRELPVFSGAFSGKATTRRHGPCANCTAEHSTQWSRSRSRVNDADSWCVACVRYWQVYKRIRIVGVVLPHVLGRVGPCDNCHVTTTGMDRWLPSQPDRAKTWCYACYTYWVLNNRLRVIADLAHIGARKGPCDHCAKAVQKSDFRPCLTNRRVDWCDNCWKYYKKHGVLRDLTSGNGMRRSR